MGLGKSVGCLVLLCSLVTSCALSEQQIIGSQVKNKAANLAASKVASQPSVVQYTSPPNTPSASSVDTHYEFSQQDIDALILNAFNEARGESDSGIKAILGVTMARVESACYPDSVHEVVYQSKQFSWTWQRGSARTLVAAKSSEPATYIRVKSVVEDYIAEGAKPSQAVLYHTRSVAPSWTRSPSVERVKVMGQHIFYEDNAC